VLTWLQQLVHTLIHNAAPLFVHRAAGLTVDTAHKSIRAIVVRSRKSWCTKPIESCIGTRNTRLRRAWFGNEFRVKLDLRLSAAGAQCDCAANVQIKRDELTRLQTTAQIGQKQDMSEMRGAVPKTPHSLILERSKSTQQGKF
jgi:hypothetical protein